MNVAETPFDFVTASYLTRIGNQSATTLAELLAGLEHCSDASIFHHTFQTLGTHHFLTEGFSNDFAQWTLSSTNRNDLAEQLASLDIRDYTSIAALRSDLCCMVRDFCVAQPQLASQSGLERFYFCESVEVTVPLGHSASDLDEFRDGLTHISHAAFYFHFISSRLRLQLQTNDFSHWLSSSLGLRTLADSINHIDVYTNTLDSARAKMLRLIDRERKKA
ncbi:MAG TPA: DUF5752 family protein [Candidatus Acidoferrum sp.]|nr:DUF5752 family protein [Candidatus Acidoferrum sp.]